MIAGHQVSDFAATQELLQRLSIGLSPLLTAGYAYRPNFGNYGQMSILGNIGEPVTIEVRYTDSSVRENRTAQQMAQRPRQARMVARTEPPYTRASSANFIIVHGRPAPAVVRTGYTGEEEAIHGPPWPATMKLSAATHEPNAGRLCATAQCQRTRIGRSDHCLAHVGQAGLSHAVREHTGTIDARRMSISAEILDAIKAGPLVKPIWFDEATFESPVDFSGCRFMAPISFEYASFKDTVSFDEAAFTQLTSFGGSCFHSQATFNRTRFHAAALFDAVRFISGVSFATGTFHGGASFAGAHFLASCNFNSCSFRTDVHSIFTTYLCGAVTFSGALFAWPPDFGPVLVNGVCDLAAAKFASESLVTLQITCDAASLEDTEFVGGVDLLVSPPCDVILDGAVFAKESVLTTWRDAQFPEAFEAQQRNPEARGAIGVGAERAHGPASPRRRGSACLSLRRGPRPRHGPDRGNGRIRDATRVVACPAARPGRGVGVALLQPPWWPEAHPDWPGHQNRSAVKSAWVGGHTGRVHRAVQARRFARSYPAAKDRLDLPRTEEGPGRQS